MKSKREKERPKRRLEAIAATLGAILALGTMAIVIWDGITGDGTPPIVLIERIGVYEHENGFVLEFAAVNRGGETASQVKVEGTLSRDGAIAETSETTFDYVPKASRRRGGLFFSVDPREYDLKMGATGYVKP